MGFVRVSGYSESDLELARLNAACDFETYTIRGIGNATQWINYKFGKDYPWAIISVSNTNNSPGKNGIYQEGTYDFISLGYRGGGTSASNYDFDRNCTVFYYLSNIKKGNVFGRKAGDNAVLWMSIIACPYENNKDDKPDASGGFYDGNTNNTNPTKTYVSTNYHYGYNNKKWYFPSQEDPIIIPPITDIPTSTTGSGSGGSGGNNDPEDQEDPVNPGDPDGPTGG